MGDDLLSKSYRSCFWIIQIIILLIGSTCTVAGNDVTQSLINEELDLTVDGSGVTQYVNITLDFTFIREILFHIDWVNNSIRYEEFADIGALPNGINIHLNGEQLWDTNITDNDGFMHKSFDVRIDSDDAQPNKAQALTACYNFEDYLSEGLYMFNNTFGVVVFDDLTLLAEFTVTVQGYLDSDYSPNVPVEVITIETEQDYTTGDPLHLVEKFVEENYLYLILTVIGIAFLVVGWSWWKNT